MSSLNYRPDIDGLRTIAVVPVVLFHANVAGFTGGFVGVDIFFVISGFLITTIIHRELAEGRFSILRFYERRARRILPALFAVMVASLIAGWFILAPVDYDKMGQSILSALLFVSNMWFWRNSGGYFDGATDYLPMLHTWSLAVEEQFYIFFPLLLMLLHRIGRRLLLPVIVLLVAGSLVVAIWATPRMPSASFYLLPTRIWELGIGSLLALGLLPAAAPKALREGVGALGLVGVLAPVFLYDGSTEFPGLAALPPVLGAAALIWAGTAGPVLASRLLALRPMVWIGLISYSLYLWHWPIMAFLRNRLFTVDLEPTWQVVTVLASVAAGWISWRFIERPFRVPTHAGGMGQGRIFALSGAGMAGIGILSLVVALVTQGVAGRFSALQLSLLESLSRSGSHLDNCASTQGDRHICTFRTSSEGSGKWLIWGDSHAGATLPAFLDIARHAKKELIFAGLPACPPLPELHRGDMLTVDNERCEKFRTEVMKVFGQENNLEKVFLVARWTRYVEGKRMPKEGLRPSILFRPGQSEPISLKANAEKTHEALLSVVQTISPFGADIILVGPLPEIPWDVAQAVKANILFGSSWPASATLETVSARQRATVEILNDVAKNTEAKFWPLAEAFCTPSCPTHDSSHVFYKDHDHLTPDGARIVLKPVLVSFLAGDPLSVAK